MPLSRRFLQSQYLRLHQSRRQSATGLLRHGIEQHVVVIHQGGLPGCLGPTNRYAPIGRAALHADTFNETDGGLAELAVTQVAGRRICRARAHGADNVLGEALLAGVFSTGMGSVTPR